MRWSIISFLFVGSFDSSQFGVAARVREADKLSSDGSEEANAKESYKVTLLIIRHGLSCTNIVQHWLHQYDYGRGNIVDPVLSGVGQYESSVTGAAISHWLKANQIDKIDATMASVLGRAVETSLLTFAPIFSNSTQHLEVVPFIREISHQTKSNLPHPGGKFEQMNVIEEAMSKNTNARYQLDYHWVEGVGPLSTGDWGAFTTFLEKLYIPHTLTRLGKAPDSHLVLGVTTHSKLIGRDLGQKCQISGKIQNNGVLRMEYIFSKVPPPRENMTVEFQLKEDPDQFCDVVYEGMTLKESDGKTKQLCLADVGQTCMREILEHALLGKHMPAKTTEHDILILANSMAHRKTKVDELQTKLVLTLTKFKNSDVGTSVATSLISKAKDYLSRYDHEYQRLKSDFDSIQALKKKRCLSGGFPDMASYLAEFSQITGQVEIAKDAFYWWLEEEPELPIHVTEKSPELLHDVISEIANGDKYDKCTSILNKEYLVGIQSLESTCSKGLRCYDNEGNKAKIGQSGLCAIPRYYPCFLADAHITHPMGWSHGCRPYTECRSKAFGIRSPTCDDVAYTEQTPVGAMGMKW